MDIAAQQIEMAITNVLSKGYRTADIYEEGTKKVGCKEIGELIVEEIKNLQ